MNGKERVLATLNHQPTDRTPLDCWLYQRQFLDLLAADYGSREKPALSHGPINWDARLRSRSWPMSSFSMPVIPRG
jgi:hypothetical protein